MRLYLAAPMSGVVDGNFPAIRSAAADLTNRGHHVTSPVEMNEADGEARAIDRDHPRRAEFMLRDIKAITESDAVVVLPGWEASSGARAEVAFAESIGTPVLALDTLEPIAPRAESVLREAERLVNGARKGIYGHPAEFGERVAGAWTAAFGWEADAFRVQLAMVIFKAVRADASREHRDNLTDIGGYARTAETVQARAGVPGFVDMEGVSARPL